MLDSIAAYNDIFFYVPFGVDVLLCLIQWPMFAFKSPAWLLQTLAGDKAAMSPGYLKLYDLFMLCYTGYCGLMFYGMYSIVSYPELLPAMAGLQVGIILMKTVLMKRLENDDTGKQLRRKKDMMLYTFYLPMYSAYFAIRCFST